MAELVRAWRLAEGDVLPGGVTIAILRRDVVTGEVVFATDDGRRAVLGQDTRVVVMRRPTQ